MITVIPWATYAQGITDFYRKPNLSISKIGIGFRGGINYSIPTIVASEVGNPLPVPYMAGLVPRFGYYLGGHIYKELPSNQLILRIDITLQMKEVGASDKGRIFIKTKYYSLGVTPLVGLHITKKLTVFTGVEASIQLARDNPYPFTSGYLLEIGTTLRFNYSLGRFGAEIGYFRGFTPIDQSYAFRLPGSSATNNFYNQNLQAGLVFRLNR